ncbi:FAR1 DNA-binding domain [Musa troglodytarum]|uniref:FAR1 DNA-binding domain n=1 Tax=Musa troglodytarum TaxID=320322 RepID=A0A9E7K5N5_9LILI|nr:FAR1 DNA-binding domain [Musa troglodytarum]
MGGVDATATMVLSKAEGFGLFCGIFKEVVQKTIFLAQDDNQMNWSLDLISEAAEYTTAILGTTLRYPMEQMCLVESVPGWAPPPPTQPVGQLPHPHLWDGLKRVLIVPTCWI